MTGTVATDPVPIPSFGMRSSGCERPMKPGLVAGDEGTSAPTSFAARARSDVTLAPAVTPMSLAGTTIVMSPVAGA